jgi:hypothetical protein
MFLVRLTNLPETSNRVNDTVEYLTVRSSGVFGEAKPGYPIPCLTRKEKQRRNHDRLRLVWRLASPLASRSQQQTYALLRRGK